MAQVNKISSFKSFTEIRKQESVSKLREENNLKRQESVGKIAAILDELGLTSFEGLEEDQKESIISKIFGDVSEEEIAEIEVEVEEVTESDEPKCTNKKGHLYKQIDKDGTVECVHCGLRNSLSESLVTEAKTVTKAAIEEIGDFRDSEGYSANQYYILADFIDGEITMKDLSKLVKSKEVQKELITPPVSSYHVDSRTLKIDVEVKDKEKAQERIDALNNASSGALSISHSKIRPWLQAFHCTWCAGATRYDRTKFRKQIEALNDL